MQISEHPDAVAIYIESLADMEPAQAAVERALAAGPLRVTVFCRTREGFNVGAYKVAASILPGGGVRTGLGYRAHKTKAGALDEVRRAVRLFLTSGEG